jgi:hypothetical protein
MREFAFEMALCATLESECNGESDSTLISRQLGASTRGNRILDILTVTSCTESEFDARTRITAESIPDAAIAADVGTGRARFWRDCFDCHPDRARAAVERSVDIGFFERERRNGRTYIRQTARYPDWFSTLRAIENKPDLDRPGDLASQLRTDVSLSVCDEVILATESYVTGAHLNRLPEEVGVWRFDPETRDRNVIREPERLPTRDPGIEVTDERPARTNVAVVSSEEKARLRRRLAERAYGKGWRVEFPSCPHVENTEIAGIDGIPYCTRQDRIVRPSDACNEYDECSEQSSSDIDLDAIRDEHSPWARDPDGVATKQVALDVFK